MKKKNRISKKIKFLENLIKVKDHDFYSGEYRGPSHLISSLRYQQQRNIPIIIHNGSNYDFQLIIKELARKCTSKMKCLGENTETRKAFSVELEKTNSEKSRSYKLKFIDSYRFINRSLDTLVNNISELNNNTCNKCKERTKSTH